MEGKKRPTPRQKRSTPTTSEKTPRTAKAKAQSKEAPKKAVRKKTEVEPTPEPKKVVTKTVREAPRSQGPNKAQLRQRHMAITLGVITAVAIGIIALEISQHHKQEIQEPLVLMTQEEAFNIQGNGDPGELVDTIHVSYLEEKSRNQTDKIESLRLKLAEANEELAGLKSKLFIKGNPADKQKIADLHQKVTQQNLQNLKLKSTVKHLDTQHQQDQEKLERMEESLEKLSHLFENFRKSKLSEFERLQSELDIANQQRQMEKTEYKKTFAELQEERIAVAELEGEVLNHAEELETYKENAHTLLHVYEVSQKLLKQQLNEVLVQLEGEQKRALDLQGELDNTLADYQVASVQMRNIEGELQDSKEQFRRVNAQNQAQIATISEALVDQESLLKLYATSHELYAERLDELTAALDFEKNKTESMQAALEEEQGKVIEFQTKLDDALASYTHAQSRVDMLAGLLEESEHQASESEEVMVAQNSVLVFQIESLQSKVNTYAQANQEATENVQEMQVALKEQQKKADTLNTHLAALQNEYDESLVRAHYLTQQLSRAESFTTSYQEEKTNRKGLELEHQETLAELDSMREENLALENQLVTITDHAFELKEQESQFLARIEELEGAIETYGVKTDELFTSLVDESKKVEELSALLDTTLAQYNEEKQKAELLQEQLSEEAVLAVVREGKLQERLEELEQLIVAQEGEKGSTSEKIESLQIALNESNTLKDALRRQLDETVDSYAKEKLHVQGLEEQITEMGELVASKMKAEERLNTENFELALQVGELDATVTEYVRVQEESANQLREVLVALEEEQEKSALVRAELETQLKQHDLDQKELADLEDQLAQASEYIPKSEALERQVEELQTVIVLHEKAQEESIQKVNELLAQIDTEKKQVLDIQEQLARVQNEAHINEVALGKENRQLVRQIEELESLTNYYTASNESYADQTNELYDAIQFEKEAKEELKLQLADTLHEYEREKGRAENFEQLLIAKELYAAEKEEELASQNSALQDKVADLEDMVVRYTASQEDAHEHVEELLVALDEEREKGIALRGQLEEALNDYEDEQTRLTALEHQYLNQEAKYSASFKEKEELVLRLTDLETVLDAYAAQNDEAAFKIQELLVALDDETERSRGLQATLDKTTEDYQLQKLHAEGLVENLKAVEQQQEGLENKNFVLREQLDALNQTLTAYTAERETAKAEAEDLLAELLDEKKQTDLLQKKLADAKEQQYLYTDQIAALEAQMEDQETLAQINEENLKGEISWLSNQLEDVGQALALEQHQAIQLNDEIQIQTSNYENSLFRIQQLEGTLNEAVNEANYLQEELVQVTQKSHQLEELLIESETTLTHTEETLKDDYSQLVLKIADLQEELAEERGASRALHAQITGMAELQNLTEQHASSLQSQLAALESSLQEKEELYLTYAQLSEELEEKLTFRTVAYEASVRQISELEDTLTEAEQLSNEYQDKYQHYYSYSQELEHHLEENASLLSLSEEEVLALKGEIGSLESAITQERSFATDLQTQLEGLAQLQDASDSSIATLNAQIEELQRTLKEEESQTLTYYHLSKDLEQELAQSEHTISTFHKENENLQEHISGLYTTLEKEQDKAVTLQQELDGLAFARDLSINRVDELEEELSRALIAVKQAKDETQDYAHRAANLEEQLVKYDEELSSATEHFQLKIANLEEAILQEKGSAQNLQDQLFELSDAHTASGVTIQQYEEALSELEEELRAKQLESSSYLVQTEQLEEQLASLESQADSAEYGFQVKANLFTEQIRDLQETLEAARANEKTLIEEMASLEKTYDSSLSKISNLEDLLTSQESKNKALESDYNTYYAHTRNLEEQLTSLEEDYVNQRHAIEQLNDQVAHLEQDIDEERLIGHTLSSQLAEATEEHAATLNDLELLQREFFAAKEVLKERDTQYTQYRQLTLDFDAQLAHLETDHTEAIHKISDLENLLKMAEAENSELASQYSLIKRNADHLEQLIDVTQEEHQFEKANVVRLTDQITRLEEEIAEEQKHATLLEQKLHQTLVERNQAIEHITALEEAFDTSQNALKQKEEHFAQFYDRSLMLEKEVAHLEHAKDTSLALQADLEQSLAQSRGAYQDLNGRFQTTALQVEHLQEILAATEADYAQEQVEGQRLVLALDALSKELHQEKERADRLNTQYAFVCKERDQTIEELALLEQLLTESQRNAEENRDLYATYSERAANLETQLTSLDNAYHTSLLVVEDLEENLASAQAAYRDLEGRYRFTAEQAEQLEVQLASTEEDRNKQLTTKELLARELDAINRELDEQRLVASHFEEQYTLVLQDRDYTRTQLNDLEPLYAHTEKALQEKEELAAHYAEQLRNLSAELTTISNSEHSSRLVIGDLENNLTAIQAAYQDLSGQYRSTRDHAEHLESLLTQTEEESSMRQAEGQQLAIDLNTVRGELEKERTLAANLEEQMAQAKEERVHTTEQLAQLETLLSQSQEALKEKEQQARAYYALSGDLEKQLNDLEVYTENQELKHSEELNTLQRHTAAVEAELTEEKQALFNFQNHLAQLTTDHDAALLRVDQLEEYLAEAQATLTDTEAQYSLYLQRTEQLEQALADSESASIEMAQKHALEHMQLNEQIAEVQAALAKEKRVEVTLGVQIAQLESENTSALTRIAELENTLTTAHETQKNLEERHALFTQYVANLEEQLEEYATQEAEMGRLETLIARLESEVTQEQHVARALNDKYLEMSNLRNRTVEDLEESQKALQTSKATLMQKEVELRAYQQQSGDLLAQLQALESSLQSSEAHFVSERENLSSEIARLQTLLDEEKIHAFSFQAELAALTSDYERSQNRIVSLETTLTDAITSANQAEAELSEQQSHALALETKLLAVQEEKEQEFVQLSRQVNDLERQLNLETALARDLHAEYVEATSAHQTATTHIATLERSLNDLKGAYNKQEEQYAALQEEHTDLTENMIGMGNNYQQTIAQLSSEIDSLESSLNNERLHAENLVTQINELSSQYAISVEQVAQLDQMLHDSHAAVIEKENAYATLYTRTQDLEESLANNTGQVSGLSDQIHQLEETLTQERAHAKALQNELYALSHKHETSMSQISLLDRMLTETQESLQKREEQYATFYQRSRDLEEELLAQNRAFETQKSEMTETLHHLEDALTVERSLTRDLQGQVKQISVLEEALASLRGTVQEKEELYSSYMRLSHELEDQLAEARERLQVAEEYKVENGRLYSQIHVLQTTLEQQERTSNELSERYALLGEEQGGSLKRIVELEERLVKALDHSSTLQEQYEATSTYSAELEQELTATRKAYQTHNQELAREISRLEKQVATEAETAHYLDIQLAEMTQQFNQAMGQITQLNGQLDTLQSQAQEGQLQLRLAETSHENANNRISELEYILTENATQAQATETLLSAQKSELAIQVRGLEEALQSYAASQNRTTEQLEEALTSLEQEKVRARGLEQSLEAALSLNEVEQHRVRELQTKLIGSGEQYAEVIDQFRKENDRLRTEKGELKTMLQTYTQSYEQLNQQIQTLSRELDQERKNSNQLQEALEDVIVKYDSAKQNISDLEKRQESIDLADELSEMLQERKRSVNKIDATLGSR